MDYPVWDLALGGGVLMGVVAVAHVIVSHFAIGGGLLIVVTETLAVRRGDRDLRDLARRSSLMLILISTVFGAISGVAIWVIAGLVAPAGISALIHTYVWGWAMEWVFFFIEIIAALVYYATWDKVSKAVHLMIGWIYFVSAYMSLVIINGIITFMLTPGSWIESGQFWDGFFNPTYWPSLVIRTGIALLMAGIFMVFVAMRSPVAKRDAHARWIGWWIVAGCLISYAGYRWWEAALGQSVRALFDGSSPALPALAETRHLLLWALTAALALAVVFLVIRPKMARLVPGIALFVAACTFFGGYERLREGVRKPFLIHDHMFSNGLLVSDIELINSRGIMATSGWAARETEDVSESMGQRVFRAECKACHTLDGYLGIRDVLPSLSDVIGVAADDPPGSSDSTFQMQCKRCHSDLTAEDMRGALPSREEIVEDPSMIVDLNQGMIYGTLVNLQEMGQQWISLQRGERVDKATLDYPFMPPFVGTDDELTALAEYLATLDEANSSGRAAEGGGR